MAFSPFSRDAHPARLWPMFWLLLATVVIPAGCVLYFMDRAIANEESAARQRREEQFAVLLQDGAHRLRGFWFEKTAALDGIPLPATPAEAGRRFKEGVLAGLADTLFFFDENGTVLYPSDQTDAPVLSDEDSHALQEAQDLEFVSLRYRDAAKAFGEIAGRTTNPHAAARALLARARNLQKGGHTAETLEILTNTLSADTYRDARDAAGRMLVPSARMAALELMHDPDHTGFAEICARLRADLESYADPLMPAGQRRFLMKRLAQIAPDLGRPPTYEAERLAGRLQHPNLPERTALSPTALPGYHMMRAPHGRLLAVFDAHKLIAALEADLNTRAASSGVTLALLPPGTQPTNAQPRRTLALEDLDFPGWQLVLYPDPAREVDGPARSRIAVYRWTAVLVLLLIIGVVFLLARYQRMQYRLTQLKNDLVTTVSHELKTPLASMRMLVETLLDGHYTDPEITREYLEMIHKENFRLSRLIENFLTFSRMERNRHSFSFVPVHMNDIAGSALESMEAKLTHAGFHIRRRFQPNLPEISADDGALVTVVLNLLENAAKYSETHKEITVTTFDDATHVCLSVTDRGIGLSRKDTKRIFNRFYRVDQSLSRKTDGVGLGLSIVCYILDAHGGRITVESRKGEGSVFTVYLPKAPRPM